MVRVRVKKIQLSNFMRHDDSTFEFPPSGIVVVTGPNGSGKSTFLEAIPYVMWGKTLRGTPPYRSKQETTAELDTEIGPVTRSRKGKKTQLHWQGSSHDTATNAQLELDNRIVDFDTWRRTAVFSSADAHHFSLSTDGERKRLLETVLGLTRFDTALKKCRADVKLLSAELALADRARVRLEVRVDEARRRFREVPKPGEEPPKPRPDQDTRELSQQVEDARTALYEAKNTWTDAKRATRLAQDRVDNVEVDCPTCGRPHDEVPDQEKLKAALRAAIEAEADPSDALQTARDHLDAVTAVQAGARDAALQNQRIKDARARWEDQKATYASKRMDAASELDETETKYEEAHAAVEEQKAALTVLKAADRALGLKGIRAHVLDRARLGLQEAANAWLARIFPGVEVTVGGDSDKLTLEVAGLNHPHGYAGSSGGERRRIDVAILLALAELAAGARGTEPGTLFFDEVFDTLDQEGRSAIANVLSDMAADRCVFVVTHSAALAEELSATVRLAVDAGVVSRT